MTHTEIGQSILKLDAEIKELTEQLEQRQANLNKDRITLLKLKESNHTMRLTWEKDNGYLGESNA